MDQRPNCNVFGYIDWTTGLLLSENSSEVYLEQQHQSQQHQHLLPQPTPPTALPTTIALPRPPTQSPTHLRLQPQQGLPITSPPLSLSLTPIVQLTNTSTHYTPSYTIAPTTEIVINRSAGSYQLQQNLSAGPNYLSPFGESSYNTDQRAVSYNHRYPFGQQFQSAATVAPPDPVGCSSLFPVPIPGPSRHPSSDSFPVMTSRTKSKGKDRLSNKRGTSVMSEPAEDFGSRSSKFQRSHSSSLADYDDIQSHFLRDVSRDEDEPEDTRMMTPSPTPSDEPRGNRGGGRQNHSEIEKRRRDKMNTYITELSRVVPMCITMSHKLDKLTVLRMAVQHLKTIRGAIHSYTEGDYKPSFLSDEELKRLILQSADGFLFVVGCDRGRMLYVSESVSQVLNYSQGDLLGQSWFDILHPKDVAKVKEQLSSSDLSPRERLIDAKTMLPVKTDVPQGLSRLCPGARRSFFCRMKCRAVQPAKDSSDACGMSSSKHRKTQNISKEKKFTVVHCTGYLKSWAPAKIGVHDQDAEGDVDACNLSCLVAVGRVQPSNLQNYKPRGTPGKESLVNDSSLRPRSLNFEFISRHTIDGKFVFVDQRATLLLGLLPQELLGTSMYEYYHVDDIVALTEVHKSALQTTETVTTAVYRFRVKEGTFVRLQSRWKSFRNPWTKDIEFLVAKNSYIEAECSDVANSCMDSSSVNFSNSDMFYQGSGTGSNQTTSTRVRLFSMEVEASKIGQTVADEVLDFHRSRSRSSASAISSSAVRSPGSIISCSATASPFSNVGSPLDSEPNYLVTGVLPSSFSNEDMRRNPISVVGNTPSVQSTTSTTMNTSTNSESVAAILSVQVNSNGSGSNSSGSNSGMRGNENNHHNRNNNHNHVKVRNNAQLLHILNEAGLHADEDMMEVIGGLMMDQSQSSSRENSSPGDGNDEAAMAVVMSLLEADAGLGGPVDFSGLPWPLP
ncbi:aryl hydrocarbon receptor nuclear translocator-like protein 1 isoform X1 [Daphnia pulex]|uniref:aryl hydrocarbon receptor nuclear translocator-like protein 1 isoform X1 n=2 Tax=Daphnia pulex TaxID=6669 RepID=UPI001EDF7A30|nr:aryl hydrocarbon receptor nuclear translocator-like protein 1 isoform X1 [Daphnia pulex]